MSTEIEQRLRAIESRQDKIMVMLENFIGQLQGFRKPVEKSKSATVQEMKRMLVTKQVRKTLNH
jgi:hypothetical protein